MVTEGIFDDVDEFNQRCRLIYYLLRQYQQEDGSLENIDVEALEQAVNSAAESEPRLKRIPKDE